MNLVFTYVNFEAKKKKNKNRGCVMANDLNAPQNNP